MADGAELPEQWLDGGAMALAQKKFETLRVADTHGVVHVTLDRPARRNAMTMAMARELRQLLQAAQSTPQVRAIVLRGAGGHFCAGTDADDLQAARARAARTDDDRSRRIEPSSDPLASVEAYFGQLCLAWSGTGIPTVAVLEGHIAGAGFGLACVADLVLAADTACFSLEETARGVIPSQVLPYLVQRVGYAQARRLAVCGGTISTAVALQTGLVHEVHPAGALEAALDAALAQILRGAPGAIPSCKSRLAQSRNATPSVMVSAAAEAFSRAAAGAEGREGAAALAEQRLPRWATVPAA